LLKKVVLGIKPMDVGLNEFYIVNALGFIIIGIFPNGINKEKPKTRVKTQVWIKGAKLFSSI
jgi:hypothetical protein